MNEPVKTCITCKHSGYLNKPEGAFYTKNSVPCLRGDDASTDETDLVTGEVQKRYKRFCWHERDVKNPCQNQICGHHGRYWEDGIQF